MVDLRIVMIEFLRTDARTRGQYPQIVAQSTHIDHDSRFNDHIMETGLLIGMVAVGISMVGIGLLFWVYSSVNAELKITSNQLIDGLQSMTFELDEMKSSLDGVRAQLSSQENQIKTLNSTNRDLLEGLSHLENKASLLEERLAVLENSVRDGNVIVEPTSPPILSGKAIIYGQVLQGSYGFNATERLLATGMDAEYRTMPLRGLGDVDIVLLLSFDWDYQFSPDEIRELHAYALNGGRLIIAVDSDYVSCNPPSSCSMEVARNFGFAFGDDINGIAVPAPNESEHPIWKNPHSISSARVASDAYVTEITDAEHIKVLGIVDSGFSQLSGKPDPRNKAAIVVNENPAYNGGKVLGTGYNLLLGVNGDFRMFDNILTFMLS